DASPFAWPNLAFAIVQGLGFAGLLLGFFGLLLLEVDAQQSRTSVFVALVAGLFVLILANRDPAHGLFAHRAGRNHWLPRMLAANVLILLLTIGIPYLRSIMGLAVPGFAALVGISGMLALSFLWLEGLRLAMRAFVARSPGPVAEMP
ncbi:MAG TPA: cation transporting ATPase C-terminal domain-containing protein, partial [Dokdonella sp.]|nr:cation transporting ATPase C-terminal domain-containing protein [Dokdonella sp.]